MSIELPPLPGTALIFPNGKPERVMGADMVERAVEARERILQARIAELEADAERYRVALIDCMNWMESGRASTDWGFWDWKDGDVFMRAQAAIDAARKGVGNE